ncbi:hypothetical protein OMF40_19175, partial [Bordetella pertussis]
MTGHDRFRAAGFPAHARAREHAIDHRDALRGQARPDQADLPGIGQVDLDFRIAQIDPDHRRAPRLERAPHLCG